MSSSWFGVNTMLPPSSSVAFRVMPWCHLTVCVCVCVCVCVWVYHMWTHTLTHTQGKHYLHYFPPLPLFRQRCIVSEPKLPHQQPSKYTPHPSLSTPRQWGRNPSFGRAERGISSPSSSQRGNNCRESFTNWPPNLLNRQRGWERLKMRMIWREREREREVYPQWLSVCVCVCVCVCACMCVCVCEQHTCAFVVSGSVYVLSVLHTGGSC